MQQGIKKLQWFEYFKVVFLEILNAGLCRVFANQVTYMVTIIIILGETIYIVINSPPDHFSSLGHKWSR